MTPNQLIHRGTQWRQLLIGKTGYIFNYSPEWVHMGKKASQRKTAQGPWHSVCAYDRQYCMFDGRGHGGRS
jgi:hypothetical protein